VTKSAETRSWSGSPLRACSAGRATARRDASRRLSEELLREPPADQDVADHREALALLSEQPRAGKVAAAVALERALRHEDHGDFDNELARLLSD
jgi:hypothetical protein